MSVLIPSSYTYPELKKKYGTKLLYLKKYQHKYSVVLTVDLIRGVLNQKFAFLQPNGLANYFLLVLNAKCKSSVDIKHILRYPSSDDKLHYFAFDSIDLIVQIKKIQEDLENLRRSVIKQINYGESLTLVLDKFGKLTVGTEVFQLNPIKSEKKDHYFCDVDLIHILETFFEVISKSFLNCECIVVIKQKSIDYPNLVSNNLNRIFELMFIEVRNGIGIFTLTSTKGEKFFFDPSLLTIQSSYFTTFFNSKLNENKNNLDTIYSSFCISILQRFVYRNFQLDESEVLSHFLELFDMAVTYQILTFAQFIMNIFIQRIYFVDNAKSLISNLLKFDLPPGFKEIKIELTYIYDKID